MDDPVVIKRRNRSRQTSLDAVNSARGVFADLERGCEILCLTHGQFSLIDAFTALLDHTGPADVTVSTWSAARADLEHARRFLSDGRIRSLRFVVDRSFATRQPAYCQTLRRLFGDDVIRTTRSHAKFAVVSNDVWSLAVRTSMNLNENPRLESIEVSDDPDLAAFLSGVVDELFSQPVGEFNNYAMPEGEGQELVPDARPMREQVASALAARRVREVPAGPASQEGQVGESEAVVSR